MLAAAILPLAARPGFAQPREGAVPGQALSVGVGYADFSFAGDTAPLVDFGFAAPILIATYRQRDLAITLGYGRDDGGDRQFIETGLAGHAELFSTKPASGGVRLALPLRFDLHRRAVSVAAENGGSIDYDATSLRIGGGARADAPLGRSAFAEATATSSLGYATRDLGDASGLTYAVDADLTLALQPSGKSWGIVAGYGFRFQAWNFGRTRLGLDDRSDLLDYREQMHRATLGVRW